ncbi:MAG: ABC transporter ATP-binding protein [Spirochaetae bacterium HGW-Spirochaetae-3]|jgi:simple sugar transport system ATP-binding protein|nr:MAG: ABC transporter ATP-binding protein [Spirochaetae bacterium HGW-Spirochaetae-3]
MDELLRMEGITKVYPNGIVANKNVDFSVRAGEIHGLVGENGAGKSTLMKILFGLNQAEEGRITLEGKEIRVDSPYAAIGHGIGMVHQHFMLVPSLTAAENLVMGLEPRKGLYLDLQAAIRTTEELGKKYNLIVDPRAAVRDLSVGIKQRLEILKALHRGAKILILDEPTAVLTPQETEELFSQLKLLREQGNTIVFISHKLNEIKELCDRVTIMRSGTVQGTFDVASVDEKDISRLMVGRDVILEVQKGPARPAGAVLKVRGLTVLDRFKKRAVDGVSFSVRRGEILGVAGVEGNGQGELVEAITGLGSFSSGTIAVDGESVAGMSIRRIRDAGVCHVPEDRMTYGCAAALGVEANLMSCNHDSPEYTGPVFLKGKAIRANSRRLVEEYAIKCSSPEQEVGMLSGGNIQKVVVAREFSSGPSLIVADQPTRGIDVGATEFIRSRLVELRDEGAAVLLVSADLNEVMELSDSLIVMYGGRIRAYVPDAKAVSEEELGLYMLGLKNQTPEEIARVVHD